MFIINTVGNAVVFYINFIVKVVFILMFSLFLNFLLNTTGIS